MRIKRLYTEPATIDPITFETGVNFILGESDYTSSKNNGVGKSLCVEFLNFGLLKRKSDSRVAKIPKDRFDPATFICVDFELHGDQYTIKRSLDESEQQSRPGKIGQWDKWIFCLKAATMPHRRKDHDETNTPDAFTDIQGEGGVGRDQGREDACGVVATV